MKIGAVIKVESKENTEIEIAINEKVQQMTLHDRVDQATTLFHLTKVKVVLPVCNYVKELFKEKHPEESGCFFFGEREHRNNRYSFYKQIKNMTHNNSQFKNQDEERERVDINVDDLSDDSEMPSLQEEDQLQGGNDLNNTSDGSDDGNARSL